MKAISMEDFDSLYRMYGPMILRRCRSVLKNEELAIDAMQNVFVRLFEEEANINISSSLLYTMATDECLNRLARPKAFKTLSSNSKVKSL